MVGNENTAHPSLKTRLFKLFEKHAVDLIRGSDKNVMNGKLRTFRLFKKSFSQEKYLLEIKNFKHRQAVTRIRISAHRMPVETGRSRKIPLEKRVCPICDKNKIGDEFPYTVGCTNKVFRKLRESFMQDLYKVNKSFLRFDSNSLFVYLMSMKDDSVLLLSCKYLYDINTLLDDYL